jgi:putative ABC transport system permease protein
VRDVPATRDLTYADVWLPITTSTQDIHNAEYMGSCMAILLARTAADVPAVQQEFAQAVARAPLPTDVYKWCTEVRLYAGSLLATHVRDFMGKDGPDPGVARFAQLGTGLGLLFMLLPALSLININSSRIRERSSEIGVRKAFGATSGALVRQFLIENLFLTLLGGLLGLALAAAQYQRPHRLHRVRAQWPRVRRRGAGHPVFRNPVGRVPGLQNVKASSH